MDGWYVYPEEGVGEVGVGKTGGVREVEVDDECRQSAEKQIETQLIEAHEGVLGPDLAVVVAVPEHDVLLKDGLWWREVEC